MAPMAKEERPIAVLAVSGSERFDMAVRNALQKKRLSSFDFRKNAAAARRCVLEREYDIIVINCPLPDEFGHEFAMDASIRGSASVLMVVPGEVYDSALDGVTDYGILAIPKPIPAGRLERAIRFLIASRKRVHKLEAQLLAAEEKMNELRLVNRAKFLLIEKKKMTEDEAHRFIGRQAMDHGVSRGKAAERILDELEE